MIATQDTPIRRKLTRIILLTSGAVLLLTCASFFTYDILTFRQNTVRHVSTLGEIVAANSTAALAFDNQKDATEILAALSAEPHIVAAALYDRNGKLFAGYPKNLPVEAFPAGPEADGYQFEHSHLAAFQPVILGGRHVGTLYLNSDLGAIYKRLQLYSVIVGVVIVAALLLAYGLSSRLQKQISEPIIALAETARAISERGDYSVRATKVANNELGLLTDAFNRMLTQIHRQNETLRKNEMELERRVVERTVQLQAANEELEAFSYSVSHDLRAPLRHIDGFTGLLSGHIKATVDDKGRRYLSTISESARRMGRLIDDLLVFSRMGRSHMSLAAVDHAGLVAAVVRETHPGKSGLPVTWKIAPLPPVHADVAMLRQVWVNLIDNAVKYSGQSPQPQIEIGCLPEAKYPAEIPRGHVVFFVKDNGVGFDMSYVEKLFGVFQRLHGATEFEGTGIGLANVRRIVTRHGGKTWAEGRVGEGATFFFSLPAPTSTANV